MSVNHDVVTPGIAIVRSSRGWARTLHRYVVDHGGAVVKSRPLEERQAIEDDYELLIVDDISSFLNAHIITELHNLGRRVIGVYDPEESGPDNSNSGRSRLARLGVDGVIEAQATPEEFIRLITDLAPQAQHFGMHLEGLPEDPFAPGPGSREPPRRRGHLVALLGTSGGVGATEIALELSRGLAGRGERTVLVDGDDVVPSVAQRLALPLHPNLRTAIDAVSHDTGRLNECLIGVARGLDILVGLPHPKDWVELRASDMHAVLQALTQIRPQVIVNTSPFVEDLTSFGGVDRFALTRAAIEAAATVALVCPSNPIGIARLLDRVTDIAELAEGKPLHVVVNHAEKSTHTRKEIANEIERNFTPAGIHFVPTDPKVGTALWSGKFVKNGHFTHAISATLVPSMPRVMASRNQKRGRR